MATIGQFPEETSDEGEFARQEDAFRDWVSADRSAPYPVEAGRYHLYVSLACPWAHRSLIVVHRPFFHGRRDEPHSALAKDQCFHLFGPAAFQAEHTKSRK